MDKPRAFSTPPVNADDLGALTIAAGIRTMRRLQGRNLDSLASAAQISRAHLSRIETGRYPLCVAVLRRIMYGLLAGGPAAAPPAAPIREHGDEGA
jgi:hypothetical protein